MLIIANNFDADAARYQTQPSIYRWTGSLFVFAGLVPGVGVSGLDVTTIRGTQYLAVASRYNGTNFNTDSQVVRFADAVAWHGAITYSDNYAPSAHFPTRTIAASSSVSNAFSRIDVALQADRALPSLSRITIGGLEGVQTASGTLPLAGRDSALFNNTLSWDRATHTAVFTLAAPLSGGEGVALAFTLRNSISKP